MVENWRFFVGIVGKSCVFARTRIEILKSNIKLLQKINGSVLKIKYDSVSCNNENRDRYDSRQKKHTEQIMHEMLALLCDIIDEDKEKKWNKDNNTNNEQQTRFKSVSIGDDIAFHKNLLSFFGMSVCISIPQKKMGVNDNHQNSLVRKHSKSAPAW